MDDIYDSDLRVSVMLLNEIDLFYAEIAYLYDLGLREGDLIFILGGGII
jgi:hypothetical protein